MSILFMGLGAGAVVGSLLPPRVRPFDDYARVLGVALILLGVLVR